MLNKGINMKHLEDTMIKNVKVEQSSSGNIWKYVFYPENAITESVLYKYNSFMDRTVLCISVQSGCPVGCSFCGTGKNFIRNLTADEIVTQVHYIFKDKDIDINKVKKLQIMFMSMGEPFLNYIEVASAIRILNAIYPTAQLLVSTIAPKMVVILEDFIQMSDNIPQIGLQFSIHKSDDDRRNELIPFKNKLSLIEIRDYGIKWWKATGRKPYCNYCIDYFNNKHTDFISLRDMFPKDIFCFTFSVICPLDKCDMHQDLTEIREFEQSFIDAGYDTRIFDPDGQDDIGAGCGQLWFVQDFLKESK